MASTFRGLLGEKLGMTQVFDENNRIVPVTVVTEKRSDPLDAQARLLDYANSFEARWRARAITD